MQTGKVFDKFEISMVRSYCNTMLKYRDVANTREHTPRELDVFSLGFYNSSQFFLSGKVHLMFEAKNALTLKYGRKCLLMLTS